MGLLLVGGGDGGFSLRDCEDVRYVKSSGDEGEHFDILSGSGWELIVRSCDRRGPVSSSGSA